MTFAKTGTALIRLLRLWMVIAAEQLLIFPVTYLIIRMADIPNILRFFAIFLAIALLLMLLREFLPRKYRPTILAFGFLCGVLLCYFTSPLLVFRIVTPFYLAAFLWHAVTMTEIGHHGPFFTSFILLGFILYPTVTWVLSHSPTYVSLLPTLAITGTIGILLSLILVNRQQIRDAGTILERKIHLPSNLLQKNALYVGIFLFVTLLASAWKAFGHFAMFLLSLSGRVLGGIYSFLASLLPAASEEAGGEPLPPGETGMMPPADPQPRWLDILQTVIIVIVAIAAVLLVLWGLYRLIKKLLPLIKVGLRRFIGWLEHLFVGDKQNIGEDLGFVDEVESLLKQNESGFSAARKWLSERIELEPGYGIMKTDRERIRWLYRNRLRKEMKRGFPYEPSDTPKETLKKLADFHRKKDPGTDVASAIYSQARYSEDVLSEETVKKMKDAL